MSEDLNISKFNFNEKCTTFLQKIEKDYGTPIQIIKKDLGPAEHGFSRVEDDQPIIEISKKAKDAEELIIHEAYHLRLRYDGMPNIGFEMPPGPNEGNKTFLRWFAHLFWDKVTHHYFYEKINEDLDINPYMSFKKELEDTYQAGEIKGLHVATRQISLAGLLLQTWVETRDMDEVDRFKAFLGKRYNGEGIEMGQYLIDLFKKTNLETFDDCVNLFYNLFNYIHSDSGITIVKITKKTENHKNYSNQIVSFFIGKH